MTEKEKAKAYDEAIERAKKLYNNGIAEEIFPELKESKDKKIREAILNGLIDCRDAPDLGWSNFGGIHIDDCIAWFKKQDEPKLHWINVEKSLPKQDEEVIVLCDELNTAPCYKIAFGHIVDKTICKDYNGWNIPNVVYWFPMPKLPKE